MPGPFDVAAALAQAASDLKAPTDLASTLNTIVAVARDSMPGIDHVGITLAHRDGTIETLAATDDFVVELDRLQYSFGEGPCLHAIDADAIVRVDHAPSEVRWPRFIPEATSRGLRAQLGVRFHTDGQVRGALNLYSVSRNVITEDAEQMGELFAAHVGLALGHARRIENLNAALTSRKTIGLALGILMQRLDLDEDTAFAYLTRISATSETKLREVAATIVAEHHHRLRATDTSTTSVVLD